MRTLSVEWDDHGDRYKPWRTACRGMSRQEFSDWSEMFDSALASVLPLFKTFEKFGGGVGRALARQLVERAGHGQARTNGNRGQCAYSFHVPLRHGRSIELPVFGRREGLGSEALATDRCIRGRRLQAKLCKAVKHFTSEVLAANVVHVALRTFVHRKAKEEHDMEKLRHHAAGGHGGTGGAEDDDGGGVHSMGKAAKKRGAAAAAAKSKAGRKAVLTPLAGSSK